ncbi:hypothetical protein STBA_08200 [Streptomyces sp. MP131-18]|nr:hypothetical protein STBA_08200 [Streptomyces sp. MP131-18]
MDGAQDDLEQADDTGSTLQVTDVRLHRADPQRLVGRPGGAEDFTESSGLHRVTHGGPGAVQFDVLHPVGARAGPLVGQAQHFLLRLAPGSTEAVAAAVVVDGTATDHAVHRVAGRLGKPQRLEHQHGATLPADVAVGPGVEGMATPARGQRPHAVGGGGGALADDQVDAADDRRGGFATPQALAGQVHRHQGRGLPRVHSEAGPGQAERVGDAVGQHGAAGAGEGMGADGIEAAQDGEFGVVVPHGRGEHRCAGALQVGRDDTGVFDGLPGKFQHEALLGVHRRCLAGRDLEERGVERVDALQVSGRGGAAGLLRPGSAQAAGGRRAHGVGAVAQQAPELRRARRPGEAAREADDGNGFVPE